MYFHKQNLNEKPGNRVGSILRNGRCWWHWGKNKCVGLEWVALKFKFHIDLTFGSQFSEDDFMFSIAIPLFCFYLTFENVFPRKWRLKNEREIRIAIFDWAIWWSFWQDTMEYRCNTPKWKYGNWHFLDTFLGKTKYFSKEFDNKNIEIPMPEKSYLATVKFEECTWKRARWFPKRIVRATVDIPEGVPVPGKGENSWDCGEDAIYSSTFPAGTIAEAVGKVVQSAMRDRIKYGGLNWRPSEVKA
jgi:hypothetical protein